MDQNEDISPQAAAVAPDAQNNQAPPPAAPADQDDDDAAPIFVDEDGNEIILEHPELLPPHGINPAYLPLYPDPRPGWEVPYTEAEAADSYVAPEEFVHKWANTPNHTLGYREQLRLQMQILERNLPHWDEESRKVGKQVLEMRNHSGIIGNPQLMDIKPFNRGQTNPFDATYLASIIDPVRGAFRHEVQEHCEKEFLVKTGTADLSTWDRKHFEDTVDTFYWQNGEDERLYPVFPPEELLGKGVLKHGFGDPEYEKRGQVMVRNRREECEAWDRWFEEFMKGEPGEEEEREVRDMDAEEAYLELLKTDRKTRDVKETERVRQMVERKKRKGEKLCLSF